MNFNNSSLDPEIINECFADLTKNNVTSHDEKSLESDNSENKNIIIDVDEVKDNSEETSEERKPTHIDFTEGLQQCVKDFDNGYIKTLLDPYCPMYKCAVEDDPNLPNILKYSQLVNHITQEEIDQVDENLVKDMILERHHTVDDERFLNRKKRVYLADRIFLSNGYGIANDFEAVETLRYYKLFKADPNYKPYISIKKESQYDKQKREAHEKAEMERYLREKRERKEKREAELDEYIQEPPFRTYEEFKELNPEVIDEITPEVYEFLQILRKDIHDNRHKIMDNGVDIQPHPEYYEPQTKLFMFEWGTPYNVEDVTFEMVDHELNPEFVKHSDCYPAREKALSLISSSTPFKKFHFGMNLIECDDEVIEEIRNIPTYHERYVAYFTLCGQQVWANNDAPQKDPKNFFYERMPSTNYFYMQEDLNEEQLKEEWEFTMEFMKTHRDNEFERIYEAKYGSKALFEKIWRESPENDPNLTVDEYMKKISWEAYYSRPPEERGIMTEDENGELHYKSAKRIREEQEILEEEAKEKDLEYRLDHPRGPILPGDPDYDTTPMYIEPEGMKEERERKEKEFAIAYLTHLLELKRIKKDFKALKKEYAQDKIDVKRITSSIKNIARFYSISNSEMEELKRIEGILRSDNNLLNLIEETTL